MGSSADKAGAPGTRYRPSSTIVFKSADTDTGEPHRDLQLHVFEPPDDDHGGARPCVLFFHGGAWDRGFPHVFFPQCALLAQEHGVVGVSAEYRVYSRDGVLPPSCVQDAMAAFRFLHANAADLRIDPKRVAAAGASAGGHLALLAALESTESLASLYIGFNPATNTPFTDMPGFADVPREVSRTINPQQRLLERPTTLPAPPPMLFLHGRADDLVPIATVERFVDMVGERSGTCRLLAYDGLGHGFFTLRQSEAMFERTFREVEVFLQQHGWLSSTTPPSQQLMPRLEEWVAREQSRAAAL